MISENITPKKSASLAHFDAQNSDRTSKSNNSKFSKFSLLSNGFTSIASDVMQFMPRNSNNRDKSPSHTINFEDLSSNQKSIFETNQEDFQSQNSGKRNRLLSNDKQFLKKVKSKLLESQEKNSLLKNTNKEAQLKIGPNSKTGEFEQKQQSYHRNFLASEDTPSKPAKRLNLDYYNKLSFDSASQGKNKQQNSKQIFRGKI